MLYDTLENLNQYTGLFPNLDKAIDFIEGNDVSALPLGRTEIDGDDVYVTVMEAEPTPGEGRAFETHSRYMDLQMPGGCGAVRGGAGRCGGSRAL